MDTSKTNTENTRIPVVITTDKDRRGVFFGFINQEDIDKDKLRIEEVQMAVYWSNNVRGVLGLAATGPDEKSRISKPVKAGTIDGITAILECSDEAVAAWKSCPWG